MKDKPKYKLTSPGDGEYTVSGDGVGYIRIKGGLRKLDPDHLTAIQTAEKQRDKVVAE